MKRAALSLTLIAALVGSPLPVAAAGEQAGRPANPDWARLRKLAPGAEITVTVRGSQPAKWHFVAADDAEVTLLDLTEPALPKAAKSVLLDIARNQPEYLARAQGSDSFVEKGVRVGPDGVFVASRKVADMIQLVERFTRDDIALVVVSRGRNARIWATLGAIGVGLGILGIFVSYLPRG